MDEIKKRLEQMKSGSEQNAIDVQNRVQSANDVQSRLERMKSGTTEGGNITSRLQQMKQAATQNEAEEAAYTRQLVPVGQGAGRSGREDDLRQNASEAAQALGRAYLPNAATTAVQNYESASKEYNDYMDARYPRRGLSALKGIADSFVIGLKEQALGGLYGAAAQADELLINSALAITDPVRRVYSDVTGEEFEPLYDTYESGFRKDAADFLQEAATRNQQATEGMTGTGKLIANTAQAAGNQLGTSLFGAVTGGAANLSGLSQITNAFKNANLLAISAGASGSSYIDALSRGANISDAQAYGLLSGATEYFTERLFGGNPLVDVDSGLVNRVVSKLGGSERLMNFLASQPVELVNEGLEEMISEIVTPVWQRLTYDPNADWATIDEIIESGISGVLLAGVMQGGARLGNLALGRGNAMTTLEQAAREMAQQDAQQSQDAYVQQVDAEMRRQGMTPPQPAQNVTAQQQDTSVMTDAQRDSAYSQLAQQTNSEQYAQKWQEYSAQLENVQNGDVLYDAGGNEIGVVSDKTDGGFVVSGDGFVEIIPRGTFTRDNTLNVLENGGRFERSAQNAQATRAAVVAENPQLVRDDAFKRAKVNSKTARALDGVAKALGVEIRFADKVAGGAANGSYDNGVITVALDSDDPLRTVITHETVHRLREVNAEAYNAMERFVRENMSDWRRLSYQNALAARGYEASTDTLNEETVADAFGYMLENSDVLLKFAQDNRSFAEKLRDALHDVLLAIERHFSKEKKLGDSEKETFKELQSKVAEMERLLGEGIAGKRNSKQRQADPVNDVKLAEQGLTEDDIPAGAKFSMKSPVEETDTLIALHNLTESKLLSSLRLGGFPMPSIAVTRVDIPHTNFGDITLVMDRRSIDPRANRRNAVYSADAWTPTFPQVEYAADAAVERRISGRLNSLSRQIDEMFRQDLYRVSYDMEDLLNRYGGETGLVEHAMGNYGLKAAYLEEQGQHISAVTTQREADRGYNPERAAKYQAIADVLGTNDPDVIGSMNLNEMRKQHGEALEQAFPGMTKSAFRMSGILQQVQKYFSSRGSEPIYETVTDVSATRRAVDDALDNAGYERWVRELFSGIERNSGIYNNKERFTPSGNRRTFQQTHYPVTLDNIVKAMKGQNGGNSKNVSGFFGVKSLRAGTAQRFKSITDMHKLEGRLQNLTESEVKDINDALDERLIKISGELAEKSPSGASEYDYYQADTIGNIMVEIADGGSYTIDSIMRKFNDEYGYHITNKLAAKVRDLLFDISQMPVNLFEAKPERVVGFNEILAAVVPDNSSTALLDGLEQAGVSTLKYKMDDETDRLNKVNSVENARFSRKLTNEDRRVLDELVKEFGAIEAGEKPARVIQVPRRTSADKTRKVSQTIRTVLEAGATPDEAVPTIENLVADGEFNYEVYGDKKAVERANAIINDKGYENALADWTADVRQGKVNKTNTALGWSLYNSAANAGDTKAAIGILSNIVEHQRSAAQAVQATRILKAMTPEAQLYTVQRSVSNLQQELIDKYGDRAPNLVIDEQLARNYLEAETNAARDEAMKELYRDIGKQMPSRFIDKWNAWRYLAMLGNPRTHIRNIVGNLGFTPIVAAKNVVATGLEATVSRLSSGKTQRSKAFVGLGKSDRALLSAAYSDYANVRSEISNGGKYSDFANANQYIEEGRRIFKNELLERARKGNSAALEAEDVIFASRHYAYALAQYCKANGITAEQIRNGGKKLDKARAYAVLEAQKATYRDTNAFSQMVSELGRYSGKNPAKRAMSTAIEGILPFRKTPANILVRGVEYSPIGLLNSLTYNLYQVQKGNKTSAEAIDSVAAGLTGTGLLALGAYMAAEGFVRGAGGDDEAKKDYAELMGHQPYALELPNGTSVTLDWLAPQSLPFFVGVNLWEQMQAENEGITMSGVLSAMSNVSDPLLELSCLQSLNDVFDSVSYAASNDLAALPSILASSATSYLTQAIPTLSGQIERTSQSERMTTYTSKNAFLTSDMQYALGRASSRIPGWDYAQIPYIDAWGRIEDEGTVFSRAVNNFLNPAYMSEISTSGMEDELLRLYESTSDASVLPDRAPRYFNVDGERKDLTADEYVQYATERGQQSYKMLEQLTASDAYQGADDTDKAALVDMVYEYANALAKSNVSDYKPDGWVAKAIETSKKTGVSEVKYITMYNDIKGIESLKDSDGDTIANSKGLQVMKYIYDTPGLTSRQREALFDVFDVGKTIIGYNKALVNEKLKEMQ